MSNIYVLAVKYDAKDSTPGILTFTNKKIAIEKARYYHYSEQCYLVTLRHDKQKSDGTCDIVGYVEFYNKGR